MIASVLMIVVACVFVYVVVEWVNDWIVMFVVFMCN